MTFSELEYAEGVTCSHRSAQVTPCTDSGSVTGTASYEFQNSSGKEQTVSFAINPGYTVSSVRADGEEVPFRVGDYQEYNEAMLEVTLPAKEEMELEIRYGGFPREDRTTSTMQGSVEISREYICLTNASLSPRLLNVLPAKDSIPVTMEITVPAHMSVIPFGRAEARAVEEHDDGTHYLAL